MNRGLWKPALSLVILLVVTTTVGLFSRSNSSSVLSPTNALADEPARRLPVGPKEYNPLKTMESARAVPADPPAVAFQAEENSRAAVTPKVSAEGGTAAERHQLLETIGSLIAAHCWQTYFNIGLLADGRAKGVYSVKDATKVLDSILSILGTVDQRLTALDKLALDKEDRASLGQMRELSRLLRRQANDLQSYWDNGREDDATLYESSRTDAWAAISKLLGVGR
jgi:hypothetical protein